MTADDAVWGTTYPFSTTDLDGDGIHDILTMGGYASVTQPQQTAFSYVRGQPDGLFATGGFVVEGAVGGMATGDLNNDGHPDFFFASWSEQSNLDGRAINWVVLSGSGGTSNGTRLAKLSAVVTSSGLSAGAHGDVGAALVGDLNNDENLDGIVIEQHQLFDGTQNYSRVVVALGDGKGGFTSSAEVPGTDGVTSVSLSDVNTDGNLDLQVRVSNATTPTTFYGDGAGNFSTTPP